MTNREIILASSSPRRKDILNDAGFSFKMVKPLVDEKLDYDVRNTKDVGELAKQLSREKAMSVAKLYPDLFVLGADTLVFCNHQLMGKPKHIDEAKKFLKSISGRIHQVISAFCWINLNNNVDHALYSVTNVLVKSLTQNEIDEYIHHDDVLDAAGAYKIQGFFSRYITKIEGSYQNVVGLPIDLVYESFCQLNGQK